MASRNTGYPDVHRMRRKKVVENKTTLIMADIIETKKEKTLESKREKKLCRRCLVVVHCCSPLLPSSVVATFRCHLLSPSAAVCYHIGIMSSSYPRNNFLKTGVMFLEFEDELDNFAGGLSSVGNNARSSCQQPVTPTPRRRAQSRLLKLERHIAIHECIPMTIAPDAEKPIFPHVWFFVLDFNDQAMNRFVEHQILTTFKEFRTDCHRHFKKYSDPEEARANPPNILEQSSMNKAARQKQSYNHNSGSKSFLQRQHELDEKKGESIDRVELFRETHVRAEKFVLQATEDVHPTPEGSQPLFGDEICDEVLGRQLGYSKGLGWGPKSKARKTMSGSSSTTSCPSSTQKEIELQSKINEALEQIEVQDRNHTALASQVEQMEKLIKDLTRAQQGPPHDP
ncbi:CACTA en-spm transposon protein [Cucumis melo var. makuwa]|uniref:CACTA en-spm transposon protein n=1 Tax=Cucumis melo var. makuwa TaxID=1194695 RepID=A0A5D3CAT5_CUCMM|nr:CACTA en-spm transposon protein [Cucumis melo var. makuwa]TYK08971.1 CACTA en-spm transposon protein [Cucumis melo var. makuwa]